MFGRKKNRSRTAEVDTVIGARVTMSGNIEFAGGLHLDGVVRGNITAIGDDINAIVIISEHAEVDGEVHVPNVVLNGRVVGDVIATERVELHQLARVSGNVYYHSMEMVIGAEVNGQLLRREPDELKAMLNSGQESQAVAEASPAQSTAQEIQPAGAE